MARKASSDTFCGTDPSFILPKFIATFMDLSFPQQDKLNIKFIIFNIQR